VLDSCLFAKLFKGVAVKLWPVVGEDDQPGALRVYATLQQSFVQRLDYAFCIAGFTLVYATMELSNTSMMLLDIITAARLQHIRS